MAKPGPRARTGPKPKLTDPTVRRRILAAVKVGATYEQAAGSAGITSRTIRKWLEKAKDPNARRVYANFSDELELARDEGLVVLAARIYHASEKDWKAAAHILGCRSKDWVRIDHRDNEREMLERFLSIARAELGLSKHDYANLVRALAES